ncbi:MAG TPA: 50S ribosomal protein L6, partial [bacterium]|nr:50S ribosomal protein L6 [bacterium]
MARLGKKPVVIPEKVKLTVDGRTLVASGEKGSLTLNLPGELSVSSNNRELVLQSVVSSGRKKTFRRGDQLLGLYRKLILNMLEGVTRGFEKILEIHGVGYKAELKDNQLFLHLGFTHPVVLEIPTGITVQIVKDTIIYVRGYDKEKV